MRKSSSRRALGRATKVLLTGGPWDGLLFTQRPAAGGSIDESAMSLPIRVGYHFGRYNLKTGAWVALV
jgi:hypothetical protein